MVQVQWLESMLKDVECTFEILKGPWQILKTGVQVYGVDKVDQVWFTCCVLHNWLLDADELTDKWNNGILMSGWEGLLGDMDVDGV
jgi:hypothetical protein